MVGVGQTGVGEGGSAYSCSVVKERGGMCRVTFLARVEVPPVISAAPAAASGLMFIVGKSSTSASVRAASPTTCDGGSFGGMMGRLESRVMRATCVSTVLTLESVNDIRMIVPLVQRMRSRRSAPRARILFPFNGGRSVRADCATCIHLQEFLSMRAEARPSMLRNLDLSVDGVAATSFCEWLWTSPSMRVRTVSMERAWEGRNGSDEEDEGGPAADAGSSKLGVSGFGGMVGCSLIGCKKKDHIKTELTTAGHPRDKATSLVSHSCINGGKGSRCPCARPSFNLRSIKE